MKTGLLTLLVAACLTIGCSDIAGPDTLETSTVAAASAASRGQAAQTKSWAAGQQDSDIVDIAAAVNEATGEFSVLIAAASRVGLIDALKADRQMTVFAPTDAAFIDLLGFLGASSLDDIDDETLTAVLLYHVVPGRRFSNSVLRARQLTTLNGAKIRVKRGAPTLIDGLGREANIVVQDGFFDIPASNGVIHVLDAVVLP